MLLLLFLLLEVVLERVLEVGMMLLFVGVFVGVGGIMLLFDLLFELRGFGFFILCLFGLVLELLFDNWVFLDGGDGMFSL